MAESRVSRKLAAILATDMVGYSRLVGIDEAGTIARQKAHRAELIDPKIAEYDGRIVKTTGDGLLVEFGSAVDAVLCAVEMQRAMAMREADVPEERRIAYRVGINLGEIVIDGDDILGDGVNVAARLEALAEPGGIRISDVVFKNVKGKLDLGFADLGPQKVKNIADPVQTYKVLLDVADAGKVIPVRRKLARLPLRAAGVAAMLVLLAGVAALWRPWEPAVEPARLAKMALPLPKKPSIAVLPFDNLSGDKAQEYLADGLSENIIQALSKVSEMFVIARNSTFTYKGTAVKVQRVAEELGVRYVLEGSVQRSGDRIRVTAKLVDAVDGRHLWSERLDRKLSDLFAVQDEITRKIVVAMQVTLTEGDQARMLHRSTNNLEAWGHVVKGISLLRRFTKEDMAQARKLFEGAIQVDPEYVGAWTSLGWTHWNDARSGWSRSRAKSLQMSMGAARKALSLDSNDSGAHALLGSLHLLRRDHDGAIAEGRKAIDLGPSVADNYAILAVATYYAGEFQETVALTRKAMRLHPRHPAWYKYRIGVAYMMLGRYEEAVTALKAWLDANPSQPLRKASLATVYSMLGRMDEARALVAEAVAADPSLSVTRVAKFHYFKDKRHLERILDALRKAGLSEGGPALPKKPSIAVVPLKAIGADAREKQLAAGLTENLISALGRMPRLFVISRGTSFALRKGALDARSVSRALGVRYILSGSVQSAQDRVRVSVKLVNGLTGNVLWAQQYERPLSSLLELQDDITRSVATAVDIRLTDGEFARLRLRGTKNFQAWKTVREGGEIFRRFTKHDNRRAREMARRALGADPDYAAAHRLLGWTHNLDAQAGWSESKYASLSKADSAARKALELEPHSPNAYAMLASNALIRRDYDTSIALYRKAIELNPNHGVNHVLMGYALSFAGQHEEALAKIERGIRLSPYGPAFFYLHLCQANLMLRRYDRVVELAEVVEKRKDYRSFTHHLWRAAALVELGRVAEARDYVRRARAQRATLSLAFVRRTYPFRKSADATWLANALRKAGLPEGTPTLPKRPSIAVLPFSNMSGDRDQEYFADGMTDDLITALSKVSGLIVISRTTAFTFKGRKDVKMKDIARSLGVRYVLEGSVRRAGGRVRINAQLIDGTTGGHVWAETFDREFKQIFALQDDVRGKIVEALQVKLKPKERKELKRKPTKSLHAYDLYLKAEKLRMTYNWQNYREALGLYDKALALDPDFIDALVGDAFASFRSWRSSWAVAIDPPKAKVRALRSLTKALTLDPDDRGALRLQARMQLYLLNHDLALSLARGAVSRHPRDASVRAELAHILVAMDRPDEARQELQRAEELAARPSPELQIRLGSYGYLFLGKAERAVRLLVKARKGGGSKFLTALGLAAAYARLNDMDKARAELENVRKIWPSMNTAFERVSAVGHFQNMQRANEYYLDPLLKAGMPEWPNGFRGRPEHRLNQVVLEKLYRRGPFKEIGTTPRGRRYEYLHDGKGNLTGRARSGAAYFPFAATITIEGNRYCFRTDTVVMGRKYCGEVYRNPAGSARTNDEYIRINMFGRFVFSIKPVEKK